jgi:hypothetical protein
VTVSSYYGKRRPFRIRTENLDTIDMTVDGITVEGVRIFVEYPDDGPPIVIVQSPDGSPLRIGALAVNTISLHKVTS